jgi:hypothetical protein
MKISSTSTSSMSSSGSGTADAVAALQKQIQALLVELKDLASSDLVAKAKAARSELLQGMIQMLQAQIAALQQQRAQADALAIKNAAEKDGVSTPKNNPSAGLGELLDTYA